MPEKYHSETPKRPRNIPPKGAARTSRPKSAEPAPEFSAGAKASTAAGAIFGLENLFGIIGRAVEQLGEAAQKMEEGQYQKQGEFDVKGLGEKARGVYGVSVKMGVGGKPTVQSFGNIHPSAKGPEVSEVREPLVDIFDEDKEVLIVAELPGASGPEIAVSVEGRTLTIEAKGAHRYAKTVELPAKVKPEPSRKNYRNGLLEVRFAKI
jgi:HSP20 family protein